MRNGFALALALAALCIACGNSSSETGRASAKPSPSGTGGSQDAAAGGSTGGGGSPVDAIGGGGGAATGGSGAASGRGAGGSGSAVGPDGGQWPGDAGIGGAASGGIAGSGGGAGTGGSPWTSDGGPFAVTLEVCDPVTAISRLTIRKRSLFGKSCTEVLLVQGVLSDAGSGDVSLPEGWGIWDVRFYDDADCTVLGDYELISIDGSVTWGSTSPWTLDIDLRISRMGNIGRPGSELIVGTDVPVDVCL